MNKRYLFSKKKITSLIMTFLVITSILSTSVLGQNAKEDVASVVGNSYVLDALDVEKTADRKVQDGVTLHCFNWSFNNIKANMAKIAEQGYTAIQTSPIQQSKEATKGYSMSSWWIYYQPMGFHIDDTNHSALGTKAEFTEMCKEAEKYGIKVIVDVVANHLGNKTGNNLADNIILDLKNDTSCWHDISKNTNNYNSRYEVTQWCMSGLPDLNTSSEKVQSYVINFLKECIDAGADGFRFDAAKHIETPDDTDYCASNFWPNVMTEINDYASKKGIELYCYGELLDNPGGTTKVSSYTKYMSVTDNQWSNGLRSNVQSGNAAGFSYMYSKDASASKLVLWAESHDTYSNDNGETRNTSVQVINKTWALIAARNDAMSLYFARPTNINAAKLGDAGITGWSYKEVKEINLFHNEFVGESEYVANESGIAYVERGDSGVVLVNCKGNEKTIDVKANRMKDGTYKDQISGNTFTVSAGRIKGEIGDTGIAVVYKKDVLEESDTLNEKNIAYINLPASWGNEVYCYVYNLSTDSDSNASWPGIKMTYVKDRIYKYEVPENIKNPGVIFYSNDSKRFPYDGEPGLPLIGSMIYENSQWKTYMVKELVTTQPEKDTTAKKENETTTIKNIETTTSEIQENTDVSEEITTSVNEDVTINEDEENTASKEELTTSKEELTTSVGENITTGVSENITTSTDEQDTLNSDDETSLNDDKQNDNIIIYIICGIVAVCGLGFIVLWIRKKCNTVQKD